jgi:hypothetical protein
MIEAWHRWSALRQLLDLVLVRWNQTRYLDLAAAGENVLDLLPGGVLRPWAPPPPEQATPEAPAAVGSFVVAQGSGGEPSAESEADEEMVS